MDAVTRHLPMRRLAKLVKDLEPFSAKFVARVVLTALIAAVVLAFLWSSFQGMECRQACFPFAGKFGDDQQCECADLDGAWHPIGW